MPLPAPAVTPVVPKPRIIWDPIPFGPTRKAEMVAYARRHYGSFMRPTHKLIDPHVIVIHFTETPDFSSTYNTFAPDHPRHLSACAGEVTAAPLHRSACGH